MLIYDITIIGGGISGLYTAYKLIKSHIGKRLKILLIEKNDRLGGRIKTINNNGEVYASGAGRFSDNHKLLLKLIKDLNLEKDIIKIDNETYFLDKNTKTIKKTRLDEVLVKIQTYIKKNNYSKSYLLSKTLYQIALNISVECAKELRNNHSYYSEIYVMNSLDALTNLTNDFTEKTEYNVLKGGLEKIIESIFDKIKNYITIKKNTYVSDIEKNNNIFVLKTLKGNIRTHQLVMAIPSTNLLNISYFNNNLYKYLKLVSNQPLYRIYAKYKTSWLDKKIVTDSPLKFIIPYNKDGLMMISYTDGKYTNKMIKLYLKSPQKLKEYIEKETKKLFPTTKIPELEWIDATSYWDIGCHYWTPRQITTSTQTISNSILKPSEDLLYIVGEAYSMKQAWIEGALETVETIVPTLLKYSKKNVGKSKSVKKTRIKLKYSNRKYITQNAGSKDKIYTLDDVSKHNTTSDAWIIISNNVYDITKWIPQHPGGAIIKNGIGKDATSLFNNSHNHNSPTSNAKNKLKEYKIGILKSED